MSEAILERGTSRIRSYTMIVYPDTDGLKKNWLDLCMEMGACCISPLHDKDIKDDGSPKKPHYHVIVRHANPVGGRTIYSEIASLYDQPYRDEEYPIVRGTKEALKYPYQAGSTYQDLRSMYIFNLPETVGDLQALVRYTCHLDSPSKYKYSIDEVKMNDVARESWGAWLEGERVIDTLGDTLKIISENAIITFHDLVDYMYETDNRTLKKAVFDRDFRQILTAYLR